MSIIILIFLMVSGLFGSASLTLIYFYDDKYRKNYLRVWIICSLILFILTGIWSLKVLECSYKIPYSIEKIFPIQTTINSDGSIMQTFILDHDVIDVRWQFGYNYSSDCVVVKKIRPEFKCYGVTYSRCEKYEIINTNPESIDKGMCIN